MNQQEIFDYLKERAQRSKKIQKLILFGSRARGDSHERSDFDVAVEAPQILDEEWAAWVLEVKENSPTLCGMDLILMKEKMSQDLLVEIQREGVVIYERK
jgi:predicted nucleotidyltransferase